MSLFVERKRDEGRAKMVNLREKKMAERERNGE